MDKVVLEKKVDNLLDDLRVCIDSQTLSQNDVSVLKSEIDKLIYECLYYKAKLIS